MLVCKCGTREFKTKMPEVKLKKDVLSDVSNYLKLHIYLVSTEMNDVGGMSAAEDFDTEFRTSGRVDSAFQLPCR